MFNSPLVQRCLHLVVVLDQTKNWGLTPEERDGHAAKVAGYAADMNQPSDSQLSAMLQNYHADHALLEALIDPDHPAHCAAWEDWRQQTRRILFSKAPVRYRSEEQAVNLEDLAQEALLDVWRGLANFHYNSQFKTWAFTIIAHCIARQHRSRNTKKRGENKPIPSLDALVAADVVVRDEAGPTPEQVACDHLLLDLLRVVLAAQPDQRQPLIFDLWANEQHTLQRIGDQVHLSTTRVHTLLQEILALLRSELIRQGWVEDRALLLMESAA